MQYRDESRMPFLIIEVVLTDVNELFLLAQSLINVFSIRPSCETNKENNSVGLSKPCGEIQQKGPHQNKTTMMLHGTA